MRLRPSPDQSADGGNGDQGVGHCRELFIVAHQAPVLHDPGEGPFNGLITNDKICLTRPGQLRLSWPRARGGLRGPGRPQLPGEVTRRGEQHAAAAATHWHVQRTGVPTETGQQRWDRAYQLLLQWATTPPAPTKAPASPILPEVFHARSDLRARLDQPPGRPPNH